MEKSKGKTCEARIEILLQTPELREMRYAYVLH